MMANTHPGAVHPLIRLSTSSICKSAASRGR